MTELETGRRALLRTVAGVGAGAGTLGVGTGVVRATGAGAGTRGVGTGGGVGEGPHAPAAPAAEDGTAAPDGVVSTRGHYELGWFNEVYRAPGVGEYEYRVEAGVPGYDEPGPSELVVFAHGWLMNEWTAGTNLATLSNTLATEGYTHPVVGFEYDADEAVAVDDWYPGVEIARRNGKKLAAFLADYRTRSPGTRIRLLGHSLGGELVLSALSHLGDDAVGFPGAVDRVTLMGAAVPDGAVADGGRYAGALSRAGAVDNFHSGNDDTLELGFGSVELDEALGNVGADGPTPEHYEDHAVPRVTNHFDYFLAGSGCIDGVVREWAADVPGAGGPGSDPGDGGDVDRWVRTGRLDDDEVARYDYPAGDRACTVAVGPTPGADDHLDLDLYVTLDGRPAGPEDYDRRSWAYGPDESVTVEDPGSVLGIAVHAYDGDGGYELTVRPRS